MAATRKKRRSRLPAVLRNNVVIDPEVVDPSTEEWREPHTIERCIWHACEYHEDKWRWKANHSNNPCQIRLYLHCVQCREAQPEDEPPNEFERVKIGWTDRGIQVWCVRHDAEVIHLDLMDRKIKRA